MSKQKPAVSESPLKQNRIVPLDKLVEHPRNYRVHPKAQIDKLVLSLQRFGQGRSIVCQDGPDKLVIVAGHGVFEAAQALQWKELRADILPAEWSDAQIEGYLIADNQHSQEASENEELLAMLMQEQKDAGFDLASLGSDDETLRQMLESLGDSYLGSGESETEEDAAPEVEEEQTRVKLGDIWKLGRHKIACVDSCDAEQVKRLFHDAIAHMVWSDPPYGIEIVATNGYVGGGEAYEIPFGGVKKARGDVGGTAAHIRKTGMTYLEANKKGLRGSDGASKPFGSKDVRGTDGATNVVEVGKYFPVIGDDSTATAIAAYRLCAEFFPLATHIWWGANYYANALPPSQCWIVWDKENTGNFADAELAWCSDKSAVRIFKHMWNGMLKDSEHGQRRVHPTQKPVALAQWCLEKYGKEQDVIYDPFLGSGISVIAAERLGNRTVIGCELSPAYINVVISRWEKETNQQAQLLERVEVPAHA